MSSVRFFDPAACKPKVGTAPQFTDLRRQTVLPGVGYNIPQKALDRFAAAMLEEGA